MTPLLDVTDAKVHFGGVHAVDGVSIQLQDGALHGLVGPNGSGKSTLLAALSRMIDLTDGRLCFKGHDYQRDSAPAVARMGIGRTFQAVRVMSSRSVLENVMLGADAGIFGPGIVGNWLLPWRTRRHERQCREMAMAAIERLELTGMENHLVGTLSYGTQRRVEIARAVAAQPAVLLFDEPTAGMNRAERDEVAEVMRTLQAGGLAQVLVEHDMQMITDVCDHVWVMNFGKLIAEGKPEAVVSDPAVQEAYLGKRGEEDVNP